MYEQEEVIEGLLCPICMKDLRTVLKLQEHFESQHENVDSALVQSIKELYGKAKKKILKQDEVGGVVGNDDDISQYRGGYAFDLDEEPQEMGMTCNHMELFKKQRHARMNNYALETNKLLNRLYRLITDIPPEPDRRKDHEKEVVPWVSDKDVKLCPNCATSFNLSKRRHHCRLCGGIMCHNCSQFIEITTAKKLTQDMFPSNSSIRSPSPIMSSSLTRRNSSAALLSSLVTPPPDPLIRLCSFCKTILDKQEVQLQLKSNKPVLIQLYEKMKVQVDEIEKLLPQYYTVISSLNSGEENYTLQEGQELRIKLMKLAENVDGISRRIGSLDTQDDILLPPIVLQVHGCIRMTASAFLRENLLGIPAVPDEKKFTELREKRMKEVQKRIQSEKMSAMEAFEQTNLAGESSKLTQLENSSTTKATTSSVTSLIRPTQLGASLVQESGWRPRVKGESVKDSQDPMIQQMNIIRDYIHQAREANKLDEVRMLENNLKELQEEYARLNLSPS